MIVLFPVLYDESIGPNILPGFCKSLENFLLVYEMDAISKLVGEKVLNITATITSAFISNSIAGKSVQKETEFLINESNIEKLRSRLGAIDPSKPDTYSGFSKYNEKGEENFDETQKRIRLGLDLDRFNREREKENRDIEKEKRDRSRDAIKNIFDIARGVRDIGKIDIDMSKTNSLSLEPTYAMVTTTRGTKILGIKVIPVSVKNSKGKSLGEMLVSDLKLSFWSSLLTKYERRLIKAAWALCRGMRILPFLTKYANKPITGDPTKDILFASTFHKRYVFCLLNFDDIKSSEFFKNAGGIYKLHELGWNSIMAADDVNKRIIWCMKQFHGICSITPYSFIYSSFGKYHASAYTDLEKVRQTASNIFGKSKFSINRLVTESDDFLKYYLKRFN